MNRADLHRLTTAIKEVSARIGLVRDAVTSAGKTTEQAIAKNTEATKASQEPKPSREPERVRAEIHLSPEETKRYQAERHESNRLQMRTFWVNVATLIAVSAYAVVAALQWCTMNATYSEIQKQTAASTKSADVARSAADTAANQLVLTERPWVKIKQRIISPLTFNLGGRASGIPVAMIKIEDTIENVGATVAVNVLSWEDVIPVDLDHSIRTARARQREYCDAQRHPNPQGLSGYTLFPHDPSIGQSTVGPQMPNVAAATIRNESGLNGKVAFVLVGCVWYRSSFEPATNPTHQTRFMYWLGKPLDSGGFQPFVIPSGVASELRLIYMPDGFTAD
jgi:hypothetical protein